VNRVQNRPAGRPRKDGKIKIGTIYLSQGNWNALQQVKDALFGPQVKIPSEVADSAAVNAVMWALRSALVAHPVLERIASLPTETSKGGR